MKNKTLPGVNAGKGFDASLVGTALKPSNLYHYQTQFLMLAHAIRPELAAVIAALAFNGGAHG